MAPLTHEAKVLGKAAMEASLTVAARARRRFKAGRPTKARDPRIGSWEALYRVAKEYEKLQGLMEDEARKAGETFDFSDTKAALVYCTDEESHAKWLPPSREGIPAFGAEINSLPPTTKFLGVLFYQFDQHAKQPADQHIFWVLQWVPGPVAEMHLRAERDKARSLPFGS
jgi:hypothetical protein